MFAETYIANNYSGSWTDLAKWLLDKGKKKLYFDVKRDQFLQDANHSPHSVCQITFPGLMLDFW